MFAFAPLPSLTVQNYKRTSFFSTNIIIKLNVRYNDFSNPSIESCESVNMCNCFPFANSSACNTHDHCLMSLLLGHSSSLLFNTPSLILLRLSYSSNNQVFTISTGMGQCNRDGRTSISVNKTSVTADRAAPIPL